MTIKNFSQDEFLCGCGCGLGYEDMNAELLTRLEYARGLANTQFSLSSAVRCSTHNVQEGGSSTSSHLPNPLTDGATAVDIKIPNSVARFKILDSLLKAGFKRIGIAHNFIHADVDPTKPAGVIWTYK